MSWVIRQISLEKIKILLFVYSLLFLAIVFYLKFLNCLLLSQELWPIQYFMVILILCWYCLLNSAFTERAICITNCIYDADNKAEDDATEGKRIGSKVEQNQSWNKDDKELDECINQAERLLLNHGYLTDAIMTKSNTFLENDTVKKILNKKWYGTEQINCYSVSSKCM